jgi:hypothetical protein
MKNKKKEREKNKKKIKDQRNQQGEMVDEQQIL